MAALAGLPRRVEADIIPGREGRTSTPNVTIRDGVWQYKDGSHLSIPGAAALGPTIDRKVLALIRD